MLSDSDAPAPLGVGERDRDGSGKGKEQPESIKVLVRVRPLNNSEYAGEFGGEAVVDIHSQTGLSVMSQDGKRAFQCTYDAVLGPHSTQSDVYQTVRECTKSALAGFNSTIFAYGQTGSGKTHSMYGPPSETGSRTTASDSKMVGLIPRAIQEIFELANDPAVIQFSVYCSFVQIYNENLFDMLRDSSMGSPLTIREDRKEIYVQGLSEYNVKGVSETLHLLRIAEENRAIRETHMNQFSSRSHSIFVIYVEQKRVANDGGEVNLRAKFNLVDLAGSEKWNLQQQMKDAHIAEMTNINLSLHTLGRCISSLAQKSTGKEVHVPYRESKLTRLLQDSLGGNSRTFLIATVSPSRNNVDETISTLKFADRAKQVMVLAIVNESRPVDHEMVMRLQKEVEYLRALVKQLSNAGGLTNAPSEGTHHPHHLQQQQNQQVTQYSYTDGEEVTNGGSNANNMGFQLMHAGFASPLGGVNLLGSLESSLSKERERSSQLTNENESLKRELVAIKRQQQAQSQGPVIPPPLISAQQASEMERCLEVLLSQHSTVCNHMEKLQRILAKFFKFEIEEDVMRKQIDQIFVGSEDLLKREPANIDVVRLVLGNRLLSGMVRQQLAIGANNLGPAFGNSNSNGHINGNSAMVPSKSLPVLGSVSNGMSSGSQLGPHIPSLSGNANSNTIISGNHNHSRQQSIAAKPTGQRASARYESSAIAPNTYDGDQQEYFEHHNSKMPSQLVTQQQNYLQHLQAQKVHLEDIDASNGYSNGYINGYLSHGTGSANSNGRSRNQNQSAHSVASNNSAAPLSPIQSGHGSSNAAGVRNSKNGHIHNQNTAFHHDMGSAPNSVKSNATTGGGGVLPNVGFRVRGNGNGLGSSADLGSSGGWVDLGTNDEDEEARLQKEMKKAEKRLKKQKQLQEWIKQKEERQANMHKATEDEQRAQQEAELLRDQKRKERAKKLKKKIIEYQEQIKTEAEQIQELVDLGIDPSSLYD